MKVDPADAHANFSFTRDIQGFVSVIERNQPGAKNLLFCGAVRRPHEVHGGARLRGIADFLPCSVVGVELYGSDQETFIRQ